VVVPAGLRHEKLANALRDMGYTVETAGLGLVARSGNTYAGHRYHLWRASFVALAGSDNAIGLATVLKAARVESVTKQVAVVVEVIVRPAFFPRTMAVRAFGDDPPAQLRDQTREGAVRKARTKRYFEASLLTGVVATKPITPAELRRTAHAVANAVVEASREGSVRLHAVPMLRARWSLDTRRVRSGLVFNEQEACHWVPSKDVLVELAGQKTLSPPSGLPSQHLDPGDPRRGRGEA
jgi:hypothetical protein